ncbi:MAG TPA: alpha-rhamnosidase, partial [Phnomibacter sp.]|nr:alpha-rhamnosidase [Phnomibacter sp.]
MRKKMVNNAWKYRNLMLLLATLLLAIYTQALQAQDIRAVNGLPIASRLLNNYWEARWVVCPAEPVQQFGVYQFRRTVSLTQLPDSCVLHVSADNRFRLFVNGIPVAEGPARSNPNQWYYQTIDIAPYLRPGSNTLAAQVWNYAEHRPFAQMSYQTGFLVQANSKQQQVWNTGPAQSWKVLKNKAYQPLPLNKAALRTYLVTGDGDAVDAALYPWHWQEPSYDDSQWPWAESTWFVAKPRGLGTDGNWALLPAPIPAIQHGLHSFAKCLQAPNLALANGWLKGTQKLIIPANTKYRVLLDNEVLTNAHPLLYLSGGKGAAVTLTYAEALMDSLGNKGNRNETAGKQLIGVQDKFVTDGGQSRLFRPLHFRTYRFVQMEVQTAQEPLAIDQLQGETVGYPFEERASFESNDASLPGIWKTGWRTAKLCAYETYMDCPYYEQLQYVGDTRIQALISLYVSGDDRLM